MLHLLFIHSIYYYLFFLHYFYIMSKDFLSPPLFVQNNVEGFLGSYPLFILILYHKLILLSTTFLYIPMIFLFSMELKKFFLYDFFILI